MKIEDLCMLRHNERNISTKATLDDKTVFVKKSVSTLTNPADEYYFWLYFYKLQCNMIPNCVFVSSQQKTIVYEWLEGYSQVAGRYSTRIIEKIVSFLNINAQYNTYKKLKTDDILLKMSELKRQKQLCFYIDIKTQAVDFYKHFIKGNIFRAAFEKSLEDFCDNDVLCHGDLGKTNILVKKDTVKIVDFEYAMFSSRELDYGRVISSIFLSYYNKEIMLDVFYEMLKMIATSSISLCRLARLTGLQLTMRIMHTYFKEQSSLALHNKIITALNLLTIDDDLGCFDDFKSMFIMQ